ncbi:MAG: hypothetical protein KDK70_28860, partial [Myxococcales bacterium]|nr:hypothetical protein [Myxococcales bacterium]
MADPEPTVPALGGWERTNLMWPAVSLAMLGMLAAAAWVVVSDADQPLPPFLQPGGAAAPPRAS